ncbi:MAG: uracil-DNA glycosylase [Deltaproteobacteria bacterium]|nr:uracil-DNA glycosylase [Deltaproteobacteria bacterium]
MDAIDEYNALIDGAIERLEAMADAGVMYLPKVKVVVEAPTEAPAVATQATEDVRPSADEVVTPTAPATNPVCAACPLGASVERGAPVAGKGSGETGLFIVRGMPVEPGGEADGVMTAMIEAMKFTRPKVWLTHALRCRLADSDAEATRPALAACRPYLDEEIERLGPAVIVALGPLASLALLDTQDVAQVRGQFREYRGIKVMASYDPADIAGKTDLRRQTWADMQIVMAELKKTT